MTVVKEKFNEEKTDDGKDGIDSEEKELMETENMNKQADKKELTVSDDKSSENDSEEEDLDTDRHSKRTLLQNLEDESVEKEKVL